MKRLFLYILAVSATATTVSCNKLLETNPKESIDLNIATKSKDALKATIISVYASMRGSGYYGRDFIVQCEVLADNGEITSSNSNRFVSEANNQPRAQVNIWNACYVNIFRCNYIMKYIDQIKGFTEDEKQQLLGEAHFLRAYNYFDLVRSYARNPRFMYDFDLGVPIVTDAILDVTDPAFPGYPARAKVDEVYAQIVKDLDSAELKLGRAEASSITQIAPFRASKLAAVALNSRVKLYRGDWAGAEASATSAISLMPFNSPKLKVEFVSDSATYMSKWGNLHPEMIFGLSFEAYESLGTDAIQYIYYKHPILGGYGDITARAELLADYYGGTADPRRRSLIKQDVKSSQIVYYCLKWPGAKPYRGGDDIMLIRASEVYLNRAEARAMQPGKESGAMDDLNKVHTRTKLAPIAALTGDDLTKEIWRERRIELAFEGHRLFDLLRTGRNIVKGATTIENKDYRLVAPIPTTETDVNKNLKPNPFY